MADAIIWKAALGRCGLSHPQIVALEEQSILEKEDFNALTRANLRETCTLIREKERKNANGEIINKIEIVPIVEM